jgi:CheY-like chemotaxis protein
MKPEFLCVLVVEDDPLVRAVAADALRDEGFQVSEASTAEEALWACVDKSADVLFTDIMLPGEITGWDIAERCRKSKPDLPVIYATGYSRVHARPVPGGIIFNKPYPIEKLVATVRHLTGV